MNPKVEPTVTVLGHPQKESRPLGYAIPAYMDQSSCELMDLLLDPELRPLMEQAVDGELDIPAGGGRLRVDLKLDNIRLWQETFDRIQPSGNLLLACEENGGSLSSTQLTWVVGAAIRSASVSGTHEAESVLTDLGVDALLTDAARRNCPGLGGRITWAFYLERHGWLKATPVNCQGRSSTG